MITLSWRVGESPSGPYRSFFQREWPSASFKNSESELPAARISCVDDSGFIDSYTPGKAKSGLHGPLTVSIAIYNDENYKFKWMRAKKKCLSVEEAKALAAQIFESHPSWRPRKVTS